MLRLLAPQVVRRSVRWFGNVQVPFQEDLTAADADDFNLGDFQHYQESPDLKRRRHQLEIGDDGPASSPASIQKPRQQNHDFISMCQKKEAVVFSSKLTDPYLNLAIEDYIYNQMPLEKESSTLYNRLMFYTNSPCVVIGKNQNPWQEVNLPLLNSLGIPLVRRRSGGGTVVHDLGNVNYSFMTTKGEFDRFKFARVVVDAVNGCDGKHQTDVNTRGDIVTHAVDGINYKVSGSAYKLSKGKSYHHGTMLLNLRLDVLGKLLSRDESKVGKVDAKNSIASVKAKVTNLELSSDQFIEAVTKEFSENYGTAPQEPENREEEQEEQDVVEFNEMFGLTDFYTGKTSQFMEITEETTLPPEIVTLSNELREWSWKYGATPAFTHEFYNQKLGFGVRFSVTKGLVTDVAVDYNHGMLREEQVRESFEFLEEFIGNNPLEYTGSGVAGFVTNDMISDWLGESIDGTV